MSTEKKTDTRTDEPFLSRWARVKQAGDASQPAEVDSAANDPGAPGRPNSSIGAPFQPEMAEEARPEPTLPDSDAPTVLPSLDSMTPQSDFSPFMAKDVDPQLRNLAMKKLFTDPHYNVMDRLDIYIDDYSTHAPLPMAVIRQMTISKTMRLFEAEEKEEARIAALANPAAPESMSTDVDTGVPPATVLAKTGAPAAGSAASDSDVAMDLPLPAELPRENPNASQ